MHSKLSTRPSCDRNFNIRIGIFAKMSPSSFIAIFVLFVQILTLSKAASIPTSRNPGLLWVTDELPQVQNDPIQDSFSAGTPLKTMTNKLLQILDEMQGLVELMPADDPNADQQSHQSPPCSANGNKEQLKLQYLEYYKQQILQFTQWDKIYGSKATQNTTTIAPTIQQVEPLNQIMKKAEERRKLPAFEGRQKIATLYPDCDNNNIWGAGNTIDFSFDLSFSGPAPDIVLNVSSAFVRMYKKPLDKTLAASLQLAPNRNISFISVYYKNPNNRKDPTKKGTKIEEQTFRVDEERWTAWDVRKAISAGFNHTLKYNGVSIKVADDQIRLPAREFFKLHENCALITEWPTLTPPIMRESTHHGMRTDLPFIDMVVLELPKKDVTFAEKEDEFLNGVKVMKQQVDEGNTTTSSSSEHKIRHRKNREAGPNV